MACYQQVRQIRSLLRDLGMLENDIQGWTDRLENVSAIVQRGCALSGVPDAGELLMDMIIELLQAIPRNDDPLPEATADESPAQLEDQECGPLPPPPPSARSLQRGSWVETSLTIPAAAAPTKKSYITHPLQHIKRVQAHESAPAQSEASKRRSETTAEALLPAR